MSESLRVAFQWMYSCAIGTVLAIEHVSVLVVSHIQCDAQSEEPSNGNLNLGI